MHFEVVSFTELPKLLEVLISELIELYLFFLEKERFNM